MKIAHLSDVHLGYRAYSRVDPNGRNQREVDVLAAFRRALGQAAQRAPDLILITGDLFHTVRPSNTSLLGAYQYLLQAQSVRNGAPLLIIAGNHETPRTSESGCILELFRHIPGVIVVYNAVQSVEIPSLNVHALCIPSRGVPEIERTLLEPEPRA
ncbi:MAG: metallophosphoesterase, partial [Fimbriimonadales bacterium]